MNTVQVKNTVIGEGRPKICVPIVGKTKTDILAGLILTPSEYLFLISYIFYI